MPCSKSSLSGSNLWTENNDRLREAVSLLTEMANPNADLLGCTKLHGFAGEGRIHARFHIIFRTKRVERKILLRPLDSQLRDLPAYTKMAKVRNDITLENESTDGKTGSSGEHSTSSL